MLKKALKYRIVLTELYNHENYQLNPEPLDESMWTMARDLYDILKPIKDATQCFSLVYEPNVHLVILKCVQIVIAFSKAEQDEIGLVELVVEMKKTWLKYFEHFPLIYGIAVILDPSIKKLGLTGMLEFYYETLNISFDVSSYVDVCVNTLRELCVIYSRQSGKSTTGSQLDSSLPNKGQRFDNTWNSILFRSRRSATTTSPETKDLDDYLSYGVEIVDDKFNIVGWWCDHAPQFPTLSLVARECLVVPASTIASESAFSAGGRVLDEKRARLAPETIRMCVCKNDWDMAELRLQGSESPPSNPKDDPMLIFDVEDLTESDA